MNSYKPQLESLEDRCVPSRAMINNISIVEGDKGITLAIMTVKLDQPNTSPVIVDYLTKDGTATSKKDYVAQSGTLTFNPGETLKTISIEVNGDHFKESDESFFVELNDIQRTDVVANYGTVTILDDESIMAAISEWVNRD